MFKLFKNNKPATVVMEPVVEAKPSFTETLKTGSIGLGKEILAQTISSLIIIGAANGVQYLINKNIEKRAAKEAASSQE